MTAEISDYRVDCDLFSGPLDLLLYLVRRHEFDIIALPIAPITHQYLQMLDVLRLIDLDQVGDFVVLASSLVEIKSREVLPKPAEDVPADSEVEDESARGDLITRLLEYKQLKDAAKALEEQASIWQERYPRLSDDRPRGGKDPTADLIKEVELWDLVSALARLLESHHVEEHSSIRYDDTPISVYVERIRERVLRERKVSFSSLFGDNLERTRIVSMFLAVLELLRHHGFRADQPVDFGEIWVLPPLPSNATEEGTATEDGPTGDATATDAEQAEPNISGTASSEADTPDVDAPDVDAA